MENREFARILHETADLMEIAGEDSFRIRSYRNAAGSIESHPERVDDILANTERKATEIPGVGKGIAAVLGEIASRGSFDRRDELLKKYPPGALDLLKIQGLGPKSIALLFDHFGVNGIDDLERLCREQKLRELPRMGAKLEEKVLRSIAAYRQSAGRFLMPFAHRAAAELTEYIAAVPGVERVSYAGSLRRGRETVGDLDLLVTGPGAEDVLDRVCHHPKAHAVLGHGENKASIQFGIEGLQVDVRALPAVSYGAAMQYFTGSKDHNVALRQRALRRGLTLNEYGLSRLEGGAVVASVEEADIYGELGLPWIPPELRENCGEIEAAEMGSLPKLVELGDIRADLHIHTRATDGRASLEEMAEAARERGYEYIAITDHSKAMAMSNGLDEARVVEFAARVRELNREGSLGITVLSGIECDILRDGRMDLDDSALAELDFVIGSVHSYFNLEAAEMTDRILKALECPRLRALGHLTGRLLMNREAYPLDFERIAAEAVRRGVWFEINASPERLDIHGPLIRSAKAKGAKFVINTDAHQPKHFLNMGYGVATARRGWLTAADVMNTLPRDRFLEAIQKS
jgi:DNA polymerase (family 10)